MATKAVEINGCVYEYVKEIPSDTRVKGWLVKVDGVHYAVLCAPIPRLYDEISAYTSNRTGRPDNLSAPLFKYRGTDLQKGVDSLLELLGNNKKALAE